jgi:hypothetical protein
LRSDSGVYEHCALHAPGHVLHAYCCDTAQNEPNRASVKPPAELQYQLSVSKMQLGDPSLESL